MHYSFGGALLAELALLGRVEIDESKPGLAIGGGLHNTLIDRLLDRGLIRRENKRTPGVFRTTRLPAENTGHEAELRRTVCAVLEDGETPDTRTATRRRAGAPKP